MNGRYYPTQLPESQAGVCEHLQTRHYQRPALAQQQMGVLHCGFQLGADGALVGYKDCFFVAAGNMVYNLTKKLLDGK